jgi:hypothetical protein
VKMLRWPRFWFWKLLNWTGGGHANRVAGTLPTETSWEFLPTLTSWTMRSGATSGSTSRPTGRTWPPGLTGSV